MVWNFRCEFIGPVQDISFDPSLIIRQSALLGIAFNDVTTYFLKSITLSSPYTFRVFGKNFVASMWQVLPPKCSEQHFPVKFSRKGTVHIVNMPYNISHLWSKRLISFLGKQELFSSWKCRLGINSSRISICEDVTYIFNVKNFKCWMFITVN